MLLTTETVRDRRTFQRYPCELHVTCHPQPDENAVGCAGRVTDVSCLGLRLRAAQRFEEGTVVQLQVKSAPAEMPVVLLVRVLHLHPAQEGEWLMGCRVIAAHSDHAASTRF